MNIGSVELRGETYSFELTDADRRGQCAIIGKDRVSAAHIVTRSLVDDIERHEAAVLIDTIGGVSDEVLSRVPEHRAHDLMHCVISHPREIREIDVSSSIQKNNAVLIDVSRARMRHADARQSAFTSLGKVLDAARVRAHTQQPLRLYIHGLDYAAGYTFLEVVAIASRCNVSIVVTFQYFAELLDNVRQAVLGVFVHYVLFALGPRDAELVGFVCAPHCTSDDLVHIKPGHFVTTAHVKEVPLPLKTGIVAPLSAPLSRNAGHIIETYIPSRGEVRRETTDVVEVPESVLRDILGEAE